MERIDFGKEPEEIDFSQVRNIVPQGQQDRELQLQDRAGVELTGDYDGLRNRLAQEQYDEDNYLNLNAAAQALQMGANAETIYKYVEHTKPEVNSLMSLERASAQNQLSESFTDNQRTAINAAVDADIDNMTTAERRTYLDAQRPKTGKEVSFKSKEDLLNAVTLAEVWTTFLDNEEDYANRQSLWKDFKNFGRTILDPQFHQNAVERNYFVGGDWLNLKTAKGATETVEEAILPVIKNMSPDDAAIFLNELKKQIEAHNPNALMLQEMVSNLRGGSQPWQEWLGWSEVGTFGINAIKKIFGAAKLVGNVSKMNKIAEEAAVNLKNTDIIEDLVTPTVAKTAQDTTQIAGVADVAETMGNISIDRKIKVMAQNLRKTGIYSDDELRLLTDAEERATRELYEHKGIDPVDIAVLEDRDGSLHTVALFGDESGRAMTRDEAHNLAERLGFSADEYSVIEKDARGYYVQTSKDTSDEIKNVLKGITDDTELSEGAKALTQGLVKDYAVTFESPLFKPLESPVNWFTRLFAGRSKASVALSNKETGAVRAQGYIKDFGEKVFKKRYDALDKQDKAAFERLRFEAQEANEREGSWLLDKLKYSTISDKVKQSWKDFKDLCDLDYLVKNTDTRNVLTRAGVKSYNGIYGKEVKIADINKTAGYRVIDRSGKVISDFSQFNDSDNIAIAISKASANSQELEATHMILDRATVSVKDLPEYILPYRAGGPRQYTLGTMFVKIGRGWYNPETGTKLNGFAKTLIAGYSKKDLQQYADEVNKLVKIYKDANNGADAVRFQKALDEAKFEKLKVTKYEDAKELIRTKENPTGLIDPDYEAQVVDSGAKYSYNNALDTAFNSLDDVDSSLQELLDNSATKGRPRGKLLDTVNGEEIRLVSVEDTFNKVIRKVADHAAFDDLIHWYAKDLERFAPVIKNKRELTTMGDKAKINSVVFDTERRATMNEYELNLLRAGQKYVERARGILNSKTNADVWWENTMHRLAQTLDVFDTRGKTYEFVANIKLDKVLRAIQFNAVMGWLNPAQLIKQGFGTANVIALEPTLGTQAFMAYAPVRLARRLKDVDSVMYASTKKSARKLLGVTDDEFEGLMDFLEKQNTKGSAGLMVGADRVYGDALSRDKHWVKKAWDAQYWFMSEGNAANYYVADIAAWLKFKKTGKAMKADDIAGYSQSLFLGMSRVGESAFQRGQVIPGSSSVAQWMSYPMRVLESMWDKQLTKAQKIRLAGFQLAAWGLGGTLGTKAFDIWCYDNLKDTAGLTQEQAEIATNGILGYVGKQIGVDFDEGVRAVEQFTKIFDIYDATTGEVSWSEIPALKAPSQAMATFSAMVRYFSPALDADKSTYSYLKYIATHPGIISTMRNVSKGMLMLRYGEMYNKYGDAMMQNATNTQSIWQMLGFRPYEARIEDYKHEAMKNRKEAIAESVENIKEAIKTLNFYSTYEYNDEQYRQLSDEFQVIYQGELANWKDDLEAQSQISSQVRKLMYFNPYKKQMKEEKEMNRLFSPVAKYNILRKSEEILNNANE